MRIDGFTAPPARALQSRRFGMRSVKLKPVVNNRPLQPAAKGWK